MKIAFPVVALAAATIILAASAGAAPIVLASQATDAEAAYSAAANFSAVIQQGNGYLDVGNNGGIDRSAVYPFVLPGRPAGEIVVAAGFRTIRTSSPSFNGPEFNVDLTALAYRTSSSVLATDWYSGPSDDTNSTLIVNDFSTPPGGSGTYSTADPALAAYLNAQYDAGAVAGNSVFLRLNADAAGLPNLNHYSFYAVEAGAPWLLPQLTVEFGPSPSPCGGTDFDGDGDAGTDADIESFFSVIGGTGCPTGTCDGTDFDGDGDEGTDADIEAFFRVLGGLPCEG